MLSTGNDIVALNAIDVTRTKQPNFYSKILTPTEVALHTDPGFVAIPFEVFVWLLWSIKESAFKFLQRIYPEVIFTPVKFEVTRLQIPSGFKIQDFNIEELTGIDFDGNETIKSSIIFNDHIFHSRSLIYKQFVYTIANGEEDFSQIHWGIKKIDSNDNEIQSTQVRAFLIDNLTNNISIDKNHYGIPVILKNNIEQLTPVSFSHHDKFVAYSFLEK